ncbi:2-amino-4-hydroxy-6-hydroxymethyldihydropteridine diphosphokinase [Malonomonas rubra]|uniref:2-amino-4-hydroxy-6- hydroxymethyldihydropteridine diphosphokinase n=1 Tax=Malonomonas rubra TaxID=57040 RepID=UPI0026EE225E|nr:2-amino-4-hydroxy-6-hydroxymethyldihydropteridine diphosphokinase [Malonomonas rubra]
MTTAAKSRVFLAFGGNLEDPRNAFTGAIRKLQQHPRIELTAASSLYRTPPTGGPTGQPDYLNAVVELATDLPANELLAFCHEIEDAAGRTRNIRWEARTLDLDLLFYDQLVQNSAGLCLPHPRLQQRHFVLLPLAELAADFRHPILQQTVAEMLTLLPPAAGISRLPDEWIDHD